MKAFNDLADFSSEEIRALVELAGRLDRQPEPDALKGKVLSLLFLSPSLRTLASFQAAMSRLGGGSFVISPDMSIHGLEVRDGIVMDGVAAEHIREAVPVIASYGDAIGIRAFADRKKIEYDMAETRFQSLTDLIDTPYINMESAMNHPCQSLADWKTMDDLGVPANGGKFVLSWAYHPMALPLAVPSSTLFMAAKRGMDVTVLRPEGFQLPAPLMQKAIFAAEESGGSVRETDDRKEAMEGAHVIYSDAFYSMGQEEEAVKRRADFAPFQITSELLASAHAEHVVLHCLPAHRGEEITDEVMDGPHSVVFDEAENRLHAQKAIVRWCLGV